MLVVQGFSSILLQVYPLDPDSRCSSILRIDGHLALADERRLVLADLIALRQIGIEVVLPLEHRLEIDARLEAEAGADGLADALLVDHWQHPGHGGVDQRDMGVRFAAE